MDFIYLKMVLLVNCWSNAMGSPVAMLQHATSSQSIVFHPSAASTSSPIVSPDSLLTEQYNSNQPKYEYKYEVSDHQTGDRKSHWESREGDRVRGGYTLYEPDGALRTVEYSADSLHGFNAVVRRNELTRHQHSRPESSYGAVSSNTRESYHPPTQSGYIQDKDYSSPGNGEHSSYSGSHRSFNAAVGFSVKHVVEVNKNSQSKPY